MLSPYDIPPHPTPAMARAYIRNAEPIRGADSIFLAAIKLSALANCLLVLAQDFEEKTDV